MAARIEEAFEEQGRHAWATPERGVVVEGEVLPPSRHDTSTPTAAELIGSSSPRTPPSRGGGYGEGDASLLPAAEPSPSLVDDDGSRARFIDATRDHIRRASNYEELGQWWNSDEQKNLRRDFELSPADVDGLKDFLIARAETLKGR
jgi:hypothetical protein